MRYLSLLTFLFALTCSALASERLTPEEFQRIAASPGDNIPLQPKLAATQPLWPNTECTILCIYTDGRKTTERISGSTKTVGGKYIVFSIPSEIYGRQLDSIMSYDTAAAVIKIWGFYGQEVTEATVVYDEEKKIYSTYSSYAQDGDYVEIGVGTFSDSEDSSHTLVWKNSRLFMVRDTKACPIIRTPNKALVPTATPLTLAK